MVKEVWGGICGFGHTVKNRMIVFVIGLGSSSPEVMVLVDRFDMGKLPSLSLDYFAFFFNWQRLYKLI